MTVAFIALAISLSGTALAARAIITSTSQIAPNVITGSRILDGSVKFADLTVGARGALKGQRGPQGPAGAPGHDGATGPQGPTGPAGVGVKWAFVNAGGTIVSQSGGITVVGKDGLGRVYLDFGSTTQGKAVSVTGSSADGFDTNATAVPCGGGANTEPASTRCGVINNVDLNSPNILWVTTSNGAQAVAPRAFYVVLFP
jgi:hypothetical protein